MSFKRSLACLALLTALCAPAVAMAFHIAPTPGAADELVITVFGSTVFSASVPEGPIETISSGPIPIPFEAPIPPGPYSAWLLEPGSLLISDQVVANVSGDCNGGPIGIPCLTIGSFMEVTLFSDPFLVGGPCPDPLKCVVEDGTLQHMNAFLFGVFNQPIVEVFAFSDIDAPRVPAPASVALLVAALAGLGIARRWLRG